MIMIIDEAWHIGNPAKVKKNYDDGDGGSVMV